MKKGFTLIETICVVIILSLITAAVVPNFLNLISNQEGDPDIEKVSNVSKKVIYAAASEYISNNTFKYPTIAGNVFCITLDELVQNGSLENPIIDTISGDIISLNRIVKVVVNDYGDNVFSLLSSEEFCSNNVSATGVHIVGNDELKEGESLQLEAVIKPSTSNGEIISWEVSRPDIVSITENGLLTTKTDEIYENFNSISVTVTAKADAYSDDGKQLFGTKKIIIKQTLKRPTYISREKEPLVDGKNVIQHDYHTVIYSLSGGPYQFGVGKANDIAEKYNKVIWESMDPNIATVNDKGEVTPVSVGSTTIKASLLNGNTIQFAIRIEILPTSIQFTKESVEVKKKHLTEGCIIFKDIIKIEPENYTYNNLKFKFDGSSNGIYISKSTQDSLTICRNEYQELRDKYTLNATIDNMELKDSLIIEVK